MYFIELIIFKIVYQHLVNEEIINRILFFSYKVFETRFESYTYSTSPFGPGTTQVLGSPTWPGATLSNRL